MVQYRTFYSGLCQHEVAILNGMVLEGVDYYCVNFVVISEINGCGIIVKTRKLEEIP